MIKDKLNGADGIQNPVRGEFVLLDYLHPKGDETLTYEEQKQYGSSYIYAIDNDNIFIRDQKQIYNLNTKKRIDTGNKPGEVWGDGFTLKDGNILLFQQSFPPHTGRFYVYEYSTKERSFSKAAESPLVGHRWYKPTQLKDGSVLTVSWLHLQNDRSKAGSGVFFEKYDPISKKFELIGKGVVSSRSDFGIVHMPDDKILIIGGNGASSNSSGLGTPKEVELFDPITRECKVVGKLIRGKRQPIVQLLPNGKVLVMGGLKKDIEDDSYNAPHHPTKLAELYDPAKGTSEPLPESPWIAAGESISYMVGDQVVILSAIYAQGFDYKTNRFYKIASAGDDNVRVFFGRTVLPNKNALISGGGSIKAQRQVPRDLWMLKLESK